MAKLIWAIERYRAGEVSRVTLDRLAQDVLLNAANSTSDRAAILQLLSLAAEINLRYRRTLAQGMVR